MLKKEYWNTRWKDSNTGWDIGYASPPLMEYLDHLDDKSCRILIPGSGSGYEAGKAFRMGFHNVHYNDFSPEAARRFKKKFPDFPDNQILTADFYDLDEKFDLCLEQTSFCAHLPENRARYIEKVYQLLNAGGHLAGVLFAIQFPFEGPPFGGEKEEYEKLFSKYFDIIKMEKCYNSIIPRQGKELFVILAAK